MSKDASELNEKQIPYMVIVSKRRIIHSPKLNTFLWCTGDQMQPIWWISHVSKYTRDRGKKVPHVNAPKTETCTLFSLQREFRNSLTIAQKSCHKYHHYSMERDTKLIGSLYEIQKVLLSNKILREFLNKSHTNLNHAWQMLRINMTNRYN